MSLKDFFFNFQMPLYFLYKDIESVGLKVDFNQREALDKKYDESYKEHIAQLPINPNSPKQVAKFLFGDLGIPVRKDTSDDTLSALKNNVLVKSSKWSEAIKYIDLILDARKIRKTRGTYILAEPDLDGRMRTSYHLNKETGRTSTKILDKPLRHRKFGLPFHNITKHSDIGGDVRSMFVPDDGHAFLEADQSQAEARIVLLLAKEYDILKLFDEIDIHCLTASWIYGGTWEDIKKLPKDEYTKKRQLGKKARHAGGYGMGARRLAQIAEVRIKRAEKILEVFHKYSPGIKENFWAGIQEALVNNDKCLYTPFGRFRKFYEKWGDKLFKEAYAHIPQSTIADNTKRCMLHVKKKFPWLKICIEAHDGFTSLVKVQELKEVTSLIKSQMELPIDFSKCSLPRPAIIIPCEFKVGYENLEKMENFHV